jgi:peptidoglycan/xylan/chitin deacetylase (PgdA/CDA1 family)
MFVAVNYHYVRPAFDYAYQGIIGVTPGQLKTQLEMLGELGEFVGARQVRDAVRGADKLPDRAILATFDDGLREQHAHALPVLRALGVPALFFVNTWPILNQRVLTVHKIQLLRSHVAPREFVGLLARVALEQQVELAMPVGCNEPGLQYRYDAPEDARLKYMLNFTLSPPARERVIDSCFEEVFPGQEAAISRDLYMDTRQVHELSRLAVVGSHAHQHQPLGLLRQRAAREEIELAVGYLEEWTGARPYAMSYPYGSRKSCPRRVCEWAAEAGIEFAFTMERAGNADLNRPLHLARFGCNDVPAGKSYRGRPEEFFAAVPASNWD